VNGDTEAFGVLFTRHKDRLWAVAMRTLGDPEEAADALQDAMISAFRQAGGFRGDSAVTTWLHRIVINACLDRMRRRAARPAITGLDEQVMDALSPAALPGADETTATGLDVMAALRTLAPDQQAVLVLVDMLGYPVAEAAAVLGISPGTVKSRCARARARLLPRLAHLRGGAHRAAAGGDSHQPAPSTTAPSAAGGGPSGASQGMGSGTGGTASGRGGSPASSGSGTPGAAATGPPAVTRVAAPMQSGPHVGNQTPTGRVSPAEGGGETRL
jgi:RNA polymerase sigma-70 factor, ECF subfamily